MSGQRGRALFWGVAVGAVMLVVFALAASCDSAAADADPPVWGPTYSGSVYCGYWYSPAECVGRPGIAVVFPHSPPVVHAGLDWLLWEHYCAYHGYYTGPRRYQVLVRVHVVVPGGRSGFLSSGRTFNRTYASYERTYTRTTITKIEHTTTTSKISRSGSGRSSSSRRGGSTTTRSRTSVSRSRVTVRSGRR